MKPKRRTTTINEDLAVQVTVHLATTGRRSTALQDVVDEAVSAWVREQMEAAA